MSEQNGKLGVKKGIWKKFIYLMKKINLPWHWVLIAFLCGMFYNMIMLKLPTITAGLMSGSLDNKVLLDAIWFYVLFTVVLCADTALRSPAQHIAARNARRAIWKRMLHIRMDYYDRHNPSDLMSTITNDTTMAMQLLVQYLVGVIPAIYYVVAALKEISSYNIWLMVSIFSILPLKILYMIVVGRLRFKTQEGVFNRIGTLTAYLAERVRSLSLIKTYTNEEQELKNGEKAAHGLFEANMKVTKLDCLVAALSAVIGLIQTMVVMVFGVVLLKRGDIDVQQWIAFYMFSGTLSNTFSQMIEYWINLKTVQGTLSRTADLLLAPIENEGDPNGNLPSGRDIVFKDVSFAYGDKTVLQDVTFSIPQGSSTAIIGLCGSGKTTTISLVERFYEPQKGEVKMGGVSVSQIPLKELRDTLGYVQQGADIFSGTAREALTYGLHREVSDEEIWKAAKESGFAEVLKKWEIGLDTPISPGGCSLSGGQRQKLVLAREFMRNPDMLLLDEPTSALDATASKMVQDTIFSMFPDKTKIIVTHDLSLIERVDQIIVLNNGELVGCGTKEQLANSCTEFQNLVSICLAEKEAV